MPQLPAPCLVSLTVDIRMLVGVPAFSVCLKPAERFQVHCEQCLLLRTTGIQEVSKEEAWRPCPGRYQPVRLWPSPSASEDHHKPVARQLLPPCFPGPWWAGFNTLGWDRSFTGCLSWWHRFIPAMDKAKHMSLCLPREQAMRLLLHQSNELLLKLQPVAPQFMSPERVQSLYVGVNLIQKKISLTLMGPPDLSLPNLSAYSKPELLSNTKLWTLQYRQCFWSLCSEILEKEKQSCAWIRADTWGR